MAQLKPREKLGIFNQGRASSPVKGRGRKLPIWNTPALFSP